MAPSGGQHGDYHASVLPKVCVDCSVATRGVVSLFSSQGAIIRMLSLSPSDASYSHLSPLEQ